VKPIVGDVTSVSVPPEMPLVDTFGLDVYFSVNVGGDAVARPLQLLVPVLIVDVVVILVGVGDPPVHPDAVALILAVSGDDPVAVSGGLNLIVPLTFVQLTSPVPAPFVRAALAEPAPIVITAANGRTIAPAASMSFRVKFTCPP
jgi:hypothetical protein